MLKIFLGTPFVFAFLFGILIPLKNSVHIRGLFYFCAFIQFILSFFAFFSSEGNFSILNISFHYSGYCILLSFLLSFVLFLCAILSKTFITKLHRVNSSTSFLLFGAAMLSLFCDNIIIFGILLFWFFLLKYFISCLWCKKENLPSFKIDLCVDIFFLLIFACLAGYDFLRYFIVNDIALNFSNIPQNIMNISDTSIIALFFGFLILTLRLFNLAPFSSKEFLTSKTNPLVSFQNCFCSYIIACGLLCKIYINFDYLLYQYQNIIISYIILILFYYSLLVLYQDKVYKFLKNSLMIFVLTSIFSLFAFGEEALKIFNYYTFSLGICFSLCFFALAILQHKFQSDSFEDFKKIEDKTKLTQFFVAVSLLIFAKIPIGAFFGANIFVFTSIFALDFESCIMNLMPYCVTLCGFFASLAYCAMIYRTLIETNTKENMKISLANHQITALGILLFAYILISICPTGCIFKTLGLI